MEIEAGKIRISILDVMYGVVLTYGFSYFDQADHCYPQLFRFLFSFAIVVYDFLYVHEQYWNGDYPKPWLFIDIVILFIFSRIMANSIGQSGHIFFFWLGSLFFCYVSWDILNMRHAKKRDRSTEYDKEMKRTLTADFTAMITYCLVGAYLAIPGIESRTFSETISGHRILSHVAFTCLAIAIFVLPQPHWWRAQKHAR